MYAKQKHHIVAKDQQEDSAGTGTEMMLNMLCMQNDL